MFENIWNAQPLVCTMHIEELTNFLFFFSENIL